MSTRWHISIWPTLFVVFLVLKLAEVGAVANWSWWWVTCPIWIPVLVTIGTVIGCCAIAVAAGVGALLFAKIMGD